MADETRLLADVIWDQIEAVEHSPSHDRWHLDRVLHYAQELGAIYGGDEQVLQAAAMLHDLGRASPDLRGPASSEESVRLAQAVLAAIGFSGDRTQAVLRAIREHDQPSLRPTSVEARILKEADFLAGVGSWGILRIAMWAAETGGGVPQVLERLSRSMPARVASLEFPEAQRLAWRDMLLVHVFASLLDEAPTLSALRYPGKYVVLEGIDGSGKDTQAKKLTERLVQEGRDAVLVSEPTSRFAEIKTVWPGYSDDDALLNVFLFAADRWQQVRDVIRPALTAGQIVVSARSFLSSLAYQRNEEIDWSVIALAHSFVPAPDLLVLLDLDEGAALDRIRTRSSAGGKAVSVRENPEMLGTLRSRYGDLVQAFSYQRTVRVDASLPEDDVAHELWRLAGDFLADTN